MINTVLILLKQSEDEGSTWLKSENTTKDLSECTREQRKNDGEGKF